MYEFYLHWEDLEIPPEQIWFKTVMMKLRKLLTRHGLLPVEGNEALMADMVSRHKNKNSMKRKPKI